MLEAAAALAVDHEVGLPYDEIALAAGVGRATVYRHFPTRESLSRAMIEAAVDHWEASLAALPADADGFERIFELWVRIQQARSAGFETLTRAASVEDRRRATRRLEASLREPIRRAHAEQLLVPGLGVREVRIILVMLASGLRPSDSAGDRRIAIHLARRLLFARPA
jgi:AcrR family transcriptional regulator